MEQQQQDETFLALTIIADCCPINMVEAAKIFNVPRPEKKPDWSAINLQQAWKFDIKQMACRYIADKIKKGG